MLSLDQKEALADCVKRYSKGNITRREELDKCVWKIGIYAKDYERIVGHFTQGSQGNELEELEHVLQHATGLIDKLSDRARVALNTRIKPLSDEGKLMGETKEAVVRVSITEIDAKGNETVTEKIKSQEIPFAFNPNLLDRRREAMRSLEVGVKKLRKSYLMDQRKHGNIKLREVAIAAACSDIWKNAFGKKRLPKSLNEGRFGGLANFIQDVFWIVFGEDHKGNPASAYNTFMKYGGRQGLFQSGEIL